MRSDELTWKALFVAGRQECSGWRDGRRRVPGGYDIRLHPVARRKLQDLLLLLAAPPPAAARRECFHGRQEADPAHVFPARFRFRARFRDFLRPGALFLRRFSSRPFSRRAITDFCVHQDDQEVKRSESIVREER